MSQIIIFPFLHVQFIISVENSYQIIGCTFAALLLVARNQHDRISRNGPTEYLAGSICCYDYKDFDYLLPAARSLYAHTGGH